MKIVKTLIVILMATCFFGSAKAQVRVKAVIGTQAHHRREVIVRRPVRHYHHRKVVIVRHR